MAIWLLKMMNNSVTNPFLSLENLSVITFYLPYGDDVATMVCITTEEYGVAITLLNP